MKKITKKQAKKMAFADLREFANGYNVKATSRAEFMRELEAAGAFENKAETPEVNEAEASDDNATETKKEVKGKHYVLRFNQAVKVTGIGRVLPGKDVITESEQVFNDARRSAYIEKAEMVNAPAKKK